MAMSRRVSYQKGPAVQLKKLMYGIVKPALVSSTSPIRRISERPLSLGWSYVLESL